MDFADQQFSSEADQSALAEVYDLLASTLRRYEGLFNGLPVACFCFDDLGHIMEWNRVSEQLFHKSKSEVLQRPVWDVIGRASDREIFRALIQSVLRGDVYENLEWEEDAQTDASRFYLLSTFPLRDGEDRIVGGIGANIDISARENAEQALRRNEERWQLALRGTNDGLWDWDIRTKTEFFSPRWREMLGIDDTNMPLTRRDWQERLHSDDASAVLLALQDHLDRKTEFYAIEYRLRCEDGDFKWFLDRGQALWNRNGEALRIAGSLTDITERRRAAEELSEANEKLQTLATEDGLTGLKNHRAFQDRLALEYARAPRYDVPLSICLLDVDKFKQYNDTFGHPAGDVVLKTVAGILSRSVREADFVARYGGEEFILILPHTDAEGAYVVAERCRAAIACEKWPGRDVTASFGIATLHSGIASRADLVAVADKALYAAKSTGRNRVVHFGGLLQAREAA